MDDFILLHCTRDHVLTFFSGMASEEGVRDGLGAFRSALSDAAPGTVWPRTTWGVVNDPTPVTTSQRLEATLREIEQVHGFRKVEELRKELAVVQDDSVWPTSVIDLAEYVEELEKTIGEQQQTVYQRMQVRDAVLDLLKCLAAGVSGIEGNSVGTTAGRLVKLLDEDV